VLQSLAQWAPSFVAIVLAWMGGRATRKVKEIESKESPYEALAERVVRLEEKVEQLERERDDLKVERAVLQAKNMELAGENQALRDRVCALFGFIDVHVAPELAKGLQRPWWVDHDTLS
jgi:FtsZ-binding cell division protein ZapB